MIFVHAVGLEAASQVRGPYLTAQKILEIEAIPALVLKEEVVERSTPDGARDRVGCLEAAAVRLLTDLERDNLAEAPAPLVATNH